MAIAHHAPGNLERMHDGLYSDPHAVPVDHRAIQARTEQMKVEYEKALRIERRRVAREAKEREQVARGD